MTRRAQAAPDAPTLPGMSMGRSEQARPLSTVPAMSMGDRSSCSRVTFTEDRMIFEIDCPPGTLTAELITALTDAVDQWDREEQQRRRPALSVVRGDAS